MTVEIKYINREYKTFSVRVIDSQGQSWLKAFTPGQIFEIQQYVQEKLPGFDLTETLNDVNKIWTEEVISQYNEVMMARAQQEEMEYIQAHAARQKRLEIQYAEEQAWIENTVRTILATDVV